jgi:predicted ATPase
LAFLREISIKGLFGLYDHRLELRAAPPLTIIAGPNGIGKTTLLGLTHSFLAAEFRDLAKQHFEELSVMSENGSQLTVKPESHDFDEEAPDAPFIVTLELKKPGRQLQQEQLEVSLRSDVPSHIDQISPDTFLDRTTREVLTAAELDRRYGRVRQARERLAGHVSPDLPSWFVPEEWPTDFIETKRLDSLLARARSPHLRRDPAAGRAPIHHYLDAVKASMERARFDSSRIAQRGDRTFARRLLDKASRLTVKEPELRARYSEIEARATELTRNGLLDDSLDVLPGARLNPTEKRILKLFLDDFAAKMRPLAPLSLKLNQLKEIVSAKFLNKRINFDAHEGVTFIAEPDQVQISADALSSGEQHELALMSRLLFSVPPGTTVLIDEPELSLHVSWQHKMIGDLIAIAKLVNLSFVLATHSTAIINGQWTLVEELGPIDDENHG